MKTNEHKIIINKTARYFTLGSPDTNIKYLWFVIHGYGNLGAEFLTNFEIINNGENYFIAPEALNKFYLKGFSGKIGAAWMTKENRDDEINDYINFLNSVYESVINKFDRSKLIINVLGFSQGVPTAVRWLERGLIKADNLIIWAGNLPYDSNHKNLFQVLNKMNLYFVIGNKDRIINPDQLNEELEIINKFNPEYKLYKFNGGHEIHQQTLSEIFSRISA
ncbi:MAG: phospholipase [Bacteroidetes bacterium]|nr:phospholipase [Bacteroidota bacterium]